MCFASPSCLRRVTVCLTHYVWVCTVNWLLWWRGSSSFILHSLTRLISGLVTFPFEIRPLVNSSVFLPAPPPLHSPLQQIAVSTVVVSRLLSPPCELCVQVLYRIYVFSFQLFRSLCLPVCQPGSIIARLPALPARSSPSLPFSNPTCLITGFQCELLRATLS